MELPDELRCLTLHGLHLKRLQKNRKAPALTRISKVCGASSTAATDGVDARALVAAAAAAASAAAAG